MLLYTYAKNQVAFWEIESLDALDPVFDNLEKLLAAASRPRHGEVPPALKIAASLLDKGYVYLKAPDTDHGTNPVTKHYGK